MTTVKRLFCKLFHKKDWVSITGYGIPPHALLYCPKCGWSVKQRDIEITDQSYGMPIKWRFK